METVIKQDVEIVQAAPPPITAVGIAPPCPEESGAIYPSPTNIISAARCNRHSSTAAAELIQDLVDSHVDPRSAAARNISSHLQISNLHISQSHIALPYDDVSPPQTFHSDHHAAPSTLDATTSPNTTLLPIKCRINNNSSDVKLFGVRIVSKGEVIGNATNHVT